MRKIISAVAVLTSAWIVAATTVVTPALAAMTAHHPTACSTNWGTNPKHQGTNGTVSTPLLIVRAGMHPCFDRLVLDFGHGPRPSFSAQYVKHILTQGSGMVLKVRGHARILIVVRVPAGHGYHPNAVNLVNVAGFTTFRQVRGAGSFERVTAIGLGVRAKLPFRAFILHSGATWRLVLDVAH